MQAAARLGICFDLYPETNKKNLHDLVYDILQKAKQSRIITGFAYDIDHHDEDEMWTCITLVLEFNGKDTTRDTIKHYFNILDNIFKLFEEHGFHNPDITTEELFIRLKEGKTIELYDCILSRVRNKLEIANVGKA